MSSRRTKRGRELMERILKVSASLLSGLVASFWGIYGPVMVCVFVIIIMDVITGILKAKALGIPLSSKKGARGFWKKMALITALAFGMFLDVFIPIMLGIVTINLPFTLPIGTIVGCYIVVNESISVFENIYSINPVALPSWIKKLLDGSKEQIDRGGEHEQD